MQKIIILGAGMVGKAMAIDLSVKYDVTSVDVNEEALKYLSSNYKIKTKVLNVSDTALLKNEIKDFDLVISAVPGFMGLETIKTAILAKKNVLDISFLPEDVLPLNQLAVDNNVTVIMDCGVAPGVPNFIAGYHYDRMKIDSLEYMVGGLPKKREFPFEYKAPFSPIDVIEEYTRPARYVENGKILIKLAMSDAELISFDEVGTLEAFNSDGLRSLIYTLKDIPNMKEKTLRYPGHIKLIQALKASGFFSQEPMTVKNVSVKPIDFTLKILFNQWKLEHDEPEFTIMRVKVVGEENGVKKEIIYDLYDEFDPKQMLSSMARTTGFTGTAGAELILNGLFTEKGVFPPELVGKHENCFNFVLDYLKDRNVIYKKTENLL
ncbi:MAG: saccharopine dehydrogenase NADP-binding domain-containing protein [Bacteroidetes bacterium]|nr:saccharopine dehydrogenase NADP-binding domain-containing protein [Bacteroidota bacterium]